MRGNKRLVYILLICSFCLFFVPHVNASFACGIVNSTALSDVSAAWFSVSAQYSSQPNYTTLCSVSPTDNKYCCDLRAITQVPWAVGSKAKAFIFDNESGYYADSAELTISGQGYDIFSPITLRPLLVINSPSGTVYLNLSSLILNVSSSFGFVSLNYTLSYNNSIIQEGTLCTACASARVNLSSPQKGTYQLIIRGQNGSFYYVKKLSFTNLNHYSVKRSISCAYCTPNGRIPSNTNVNVTVTGEFSHPISSSFSDAFDSSLILIEGGSLERLNDFSNTVSWNVNGSSFNKTYELHSPRSFFPKQYTFWSFFSNSSRAENSEEVVISPLRFPFLYIPLLSKHHEKTFSLPTSSKTYASISPKTPLVVKTKHRFVSEVALFPRHQTRRVYLFFESTPSEGEFNLVSNIEPESIDRILIRFSTPLKTSNVTLYYPDERSSVILPSKQDKATRYYEVYVTTLGHFRLVEND